MDRAGRGSCTRRGLREPGEGSLGSVGGEGICRVVDSLQESGVAGWAYGWLLVGLGLHSSDPSSDPPLPTPVFPDTKPYEVTEPFGAPPGKVGAAGPGAPWEKGKSSEVSVMLTVSAAAAKVSEGLGTLRTLGVPAVTQQVALGPILPSSLLEPQWGDGGHGRAAEHEDPQLL